MNGSDEHDDDLDGVTLWSGRLRAWPVAPVPVGNEDDTVKTRGTTSGDAASGVGGHDEAAGSEDDTVSSRAVRSDDPPLTAPALAGRRSASTPGDATALPDATAPALAGRRSASTPGDATALPDATVPADVPMPPAPADVLASPASAGHAASAAVDDETEPSRSRTPEARSLRRSPRGSSAVPAEIDGGLPASVTDTSTAPRAVAQRSSASVDDTVADSRPRGIQPPVPVVDGEPPAEREARSPVVRQRESYAPRVHEPPRAARTSTGAATRSAEAGVVHPLRSRGRARLVVLTAAVVAVVALAAIGVMLLLG